ncbi:hypothetical protein EV361DRAFT_481784 [Lentinula raphanica]|nr:hypothetical protein F5880DRAFT_1297001 [Lentinula raphanica]KAJ3967584.1 hypothetical protein EV361DRAFT_481784 [Lentinula raphanica]
MSQVVASLARELVGMVTTQPSQATTGSQKKPLTAKEILAAAKNKNTDRTRSPIANIVDAESAAPKKKSGSTQSKILSSSSSDGESTLVSAPHPIPHPNSIPNIQNLDDIDSGTYLEELLGGPRQQRLTLDSILPFVASTSKKRKAVVLEEDPIIKTKSVRHSAHTRSQTWASSDSDPDYDSTSDNVEMVSSSVRVIDQPPALKTSNKDSVVINSDTNPRPPEVSVSSITSTLHGQTSPVGTAVRQTISEIPLEIHHPVIMDRPTPIAAPSIQQHTTPSDTSVAENDPIETIIPSPRSNSPIEIAPVASTSLSSARTPTNTIMYLKPEVVITRRSTRKTNSQPISKHEADIRPSVVKLTRTRSQSAVQRKNQTAPPPSPPQSPRRLRSSTQVDPTTDSLVGQTPVTVQANRSEASETMWTTLNVGPSSTGDAASSHGSDELQSSPDLDPDSPPAQSHSEAEAPLFIASESQVDFPYSQFQNLDVDTDNGANAPTNVSRLEEDSEEEVEVQKTITPRAPTARGSATYRGLSEIASQNKFFTGLQHHLATSSTPKNSKEDMYGPLSQAYDDDASDSGSESEVEKSHIPRARRAGIKR